MTDNNYGEQSSTEKMMHIVMDPGLLAAYGIEVQGTAEAIAELGRILADRPVGPALVLMAEQGRGYGVRLFASSRFDELAFVNDAARFRMDEQQARQFIANLPRLP